jgi:hypothetical protein
MEYTYGYAYLRTSYTYVNPGTIYYRFYRRWTWNAISFSLVSASSSIYSTGSSNPLVSFTFGPYETAWRESSGSIVITSPVTIYGARLAYGWFPYGTLGSCIVYVDAVQFSDETLTNVMPRSRGNVKALDH